MRWRGTKATRRLTIVLAVLSLLIVGTVTFSLIDTSNPPGVELNQSPEPNSQTLTANAEKPEPPAEKIHEPALPPAGPPDLAFHQVRPRRDDRAGTLQMLQSGRDSGQRPRQFTLYIVNERRQSLPYISFEYAFTTHADLRWRGEGGLWFQAATSNTRREWTSWLPPSRLLFVRILDPGWVCEAFDDRGRASPGTASNTALVRVAPPNARTEVRLKREADFRLWVDYADGTTYSGTIRVATYRDSARRDLHRDPYGQPYESGMTIR